MKALEDKAIPETIVGLKIAKKHFESQQMKDRIVRESIDELIIYLGNLSRSMSFPEMIVPIGVVLRKFKKHTANASHRKVVAHFLDLI
mmetsp:Transcript_6467/g.4865  ORF Transcript_6467/g.4865 Transcript_6467/m.4865 type:complete len:88 (+) Transcript_6467:689-952(+)